MTFHNVQLVTFLKYKRGETDQNFLSEESKLISPSARMLQLSLFSSFIAVFFHPLLLNRKGSLHLSTFPTKPLKSIISQIVFFFVFFLKGFTYLTAPWRSIHVIDANHKLKKHKNKRKL